MNVIVEFFKSLSFKLRILLICIISALIVMLLQFGLYDVIVNFIIAGAIPGTHMYYEIGRASCRERV